MKEIKFRAWDPAGNKMYQHTSISSLGKVDFCWNGTHQRLGLTSYPGRSSEGVRYDDMVPMQWTGLKDKNGKEIYEGDVVQVDGRHGQIGEVEYVEPRFQVKNFWDSGFDDPSDAFSEGKIEVIGNIYENPELLK